MYHLDDPDVEAQAAIKAFQMQQFVAAAKGPLPTPPPEPVLELTAKVERKDVAAEIVESGVQVSALHPTNCLLRVLQAGVCGRW